MNILFITRSYSKNKGGKEIYNYNLVQALKKTNDVYAITSSGSFLNLVWFYPYSFVKTFYYLSTKKVDVVHFGDNFMLPGIYPLAKLFRKKISITLYGLELTYPSSVYQTIFVNPMKRGDYFISISKAVADVAVSKGIPREKIKVITPGMNPHEFDMKEGGGRAALRKKLEDKIGISLGNKKILLTSGRLVKRKGVEWFVSNVIPKISKDYVYLISGEGEEGENIRKSIEKNKLEERVFMLGRTSHELLKLLYNASDVFVMPNIHVEGDMEGFGIVIIEANSVGLPVVASKIEGIKDALKDKVTGLFAEEKNTDDFIRKIKEVEKLNKNKMIDYVNKTFDWNEIAKEFVEVWER